MKPRLLIGFAWLFLVLASPALAPAADRPTFLFLTTNGPAVLAVFTNPPPTLLPHTNRFGRIYYRPPAHGLGTVTQFDCLLPNSLNYVIWTNFIAHTNGRSTVIWSERSHPAGWPRQAPVVAWATNGLMWGMKGVTALSPCWELEGAPGQVPITALTRRHGYARGHSMGPDGFRTHYAGKRVWFVTLDNQVIERRIKREVVHSVSQTNHEDYTIVLFDKDLPAGITPLRVTTFRELSTKYPEVPGGPQPFFQTEQTGHVSASVEGWKLDTWKGGDSGSPNMLPLPGELVFYGGRSTSGPSPHMQADMDELCRQEGLDPGQYQLQWVDLSAWPTY